MVFVGVGVVFLAGDSWQLREYCLEGLQDSIGKQNTERLFMEILNLANLGVRERIAEGSAVLCDRTSNYGNPFVIIIGTKFDREWSCEMFKAYAAFRCGLEPGWLDPLRGLSLACWCKPRRCHLETLIELANS